MVGPPPDTWAVDAGAARAYEVAEGIWRLRLPVAWPHMGHANAYLLDGHVLVDCGGGGDPSAYEALRAALADAGRAPAGVTDLVITHFHSDHMGCAARLVAETGCTVWAHPASEHFLGPHTDPARYRAGRERWARGLGIPPGEFFDGCVDMREETDGIDGPVAAGRALVAGMVLPGGWEVLETPGHAPSQVSLFRPEGRVLIAADLIGPVFAPYFDPGFTPDPVAEHHASLDVAEGLGADLALPGHGRPLTGLPELFAENRRALVSQLETVRAAVNDGALTGAELFERIHGRTATPADRVWRLCALDGYLEHLVRAGELARAVDGSGVARHRRP